MNKTQNKYILCCVLLCSFICFFVQSDTEGERTVTSKLRDREKRKSEKKEIWREGKRERYRDGEEERGLKLGSYRHGTKR